MSRSNEQIILTDKKIGKKIKELRVTQGFSRGIVAKAIDVTHQQLQKYELAKNRISAARLALIANFFKVDIKDFFEISEIEDCEDKIENTKMLLAISKNLSSIKNNCFKEAINQLVKVYAKGNEQN
jgi:transcriptional regulator with XRE-family HTH domain